MTMPVLFVGHGSPMNAVADNSYTRALNELGRRLPSPKTILCISAHWMTQGLKVTHMTTPRTIHDFGGFPDQLFQVQYPAPGAPAVAELVSRYTGAALDDEEWGLDHGSWSVLRHMYPKADVPVVQLSFDPRQSPVAQFEIGAKLKPLRQQGVMILGSGDIVHNLRQIRWQEDATPFPWALEFDQWAIDRMRALDHQALVNEFNLSQAGRLSVPTPDHYYPLLHVLGATQSSDVFRIEYQAIQNASISMTTVSFGA